MNLHRFAKGIIFCWLTIVALVGQSAPLCVTSLNVVNLQSEAVAGLISLTPQVQQILAAHRGSLSRAEIETLSDAEADVLARYLHHFMDSDQDESIHGAETAALVIQQLYQFDKSNSDKPELFQTSYFARLAGPLFRRSLRRRGAALWALASTILHLSLANGEKGMDEVLDVFLIIYYKSQKATGLGDLDLAAIMDSGGLYNLNSPYVSAYKELRRHVELILEKSTFSKTDKMRVIETLYRGFVLACELRAQRASQQDAGRRDHFAGERIPLAYGEAIEATKFFDSLDLRQLVDIDFPAELTRLENEKIQSQQRFAGRPFPSVVPRDGKKKDSLSNSRSGRSIQVSQ